MKGDWDQFINLAKKHPGEDIWVLFERWQNMKVVTKNNLDGKIVEFFVVI